MYLLAWILIGAVVGWGTGRVLQGNGYGPFMDTFMGVAGAVAGGFLMRSAGLVGGYGGTIVTALVAMIGAVLLTMFAGFANGRRIYARQL
jgi:uncharacterized membrane protein YeaQ/YmgE (transglycosylase-associated protein family)